MKHSPPHILENVVTLLTPPSCREHVLGDLYERYRSPWQYIADAACALPFVVFSRIRRTTDGQILFTEALAVYLCFLVAAWRLDGAVFLNEHAGFWRLAIPTASWIIGLLMVNAYADRLSRYAPLRDAGFGVASAFLSQAVVVAAGLKLLVPLPTIVSGAGLGVLLTSTLRVMFAPGPFTPVLEAGSSKAQPSPPKNRPPLWTVVVWIGALVSLSFLFFTKRGGRRR